MTHEEIIAAVESMTVLELADLVKAMEEKFGVSAAAPVAVVAGGAGAAAAGPRFGHQHGLDVRRYHLRCYLRR